MPLVAATATDGIVVHVPGSSGFAPEFGGAIDWNSIAIGTLRGRAQIEFIATPINGAGPRALGEETTQPLPAITLTGNGLKTPTRTIPVVPNTGYIDFAYPRRDALVLRGWVGDTTTGIPAQQILVTRMGASSLPDRRTSEARRRGRHSGAGMVRAGYRIVLPLRDLIGEVRGATSAVLDAGGRAFEVIYTPSFGWR